MGQVLCSQHFEAYCCKFVTELTSNKSLRKHRRLKANANCHSDMLQLQVALASFKRLLRFQKLFFKGRCVKILKQYASKSLLHKTWPFGGDCCIGVGSNYTLAGLNRWK